MKSPIPQDKSFPFTLLSLVLLGWLVSAQSAAAQSTAFTYQGRAVYQGYSANAYLDMTFGLFDADTDGTQIGSTITNLNVAVSNGLFTATLDFGAGAFPGADRWLELGVRTNGAGGFSTLSPRQLLTSAPYAVTATTAGGGWPTTWSGSAITSAVAEATHAANADNSTTASGGWPTTWDGSAITSGTVADARLSANVPLLNGNPTFTGTVSFTGPVSATAGGVNYYMVPKGAIVLWSGSVASIPSGWALCDGQNSTPNLTNQFVVGAGDTTQGAVYAVGTTGGFTNHTHAVGSFGIPVSTYTTGSESSHTHGPGTFATAATSTGSESSHTHSTPNHTHTVPSHNHTGGDLAFSRQYGSSAGYTGGGQGGFSISVINTTSSVCLPNSAQWFGHTGGTSLTTDSGGGGTTGAGSAHSHTIAALAVSTGTSGAGSAHSHTIPAMSVTGTSASADSRPPYYALCYIMKL